MSAMSGLSCGSGFSEQELPGSWATGKSSFVQEELKAQVVSFWKFLKGPIVSKSHWAMFSSWVPSTVYVCFLVVVFI